MKHELIQILIAIITLLPATVAAENNTGHALDGSPIEIRVRAGYNIGGTAPIGMPETIRSIDAFRLTPSVMVGFDVAMHLQGKWGVATGLRFENKAMDADVTTKAYNMEMKKNNDQISGLFTGHVSQQVTQWMFTLPIEATFLLSRKLQLKAGPYFSLLVSKDFSGIASDGYLRQGDPTGPKIIMGDKEGEWATYDFTDDMRPLQMGIAAGIDWQLYRGLGISADLNWGLTGIFKSDFKTVEQTLYPIYGTISLFYRLK